VNQVETLKKVHAPPRWCRLLAEAGATGTPTSRSVAGECEPAHTLKAFNHGMLDVGARPFSSAENAERTS
jgi:hypothetical protein